MTPLALIRHGPTAWSAGGRIHGGADVPLSAAGRARVAGWRLPAEIGGYAWLASPLRRALETATLLAGSPPPTDRRLAEMDWGEWEGRRLAELRAEMGKAMAELEARGLDFRPPGGETPREVQARVRPLLAEVAALGRPTVAVTHKGVARAIYAAAAGWDMTGKPPHRMRDGCVQLFLLADGGAPRIGRLNIRLDGR